MPLYNPRLNAWEDHFEMQAFVIVGLTAVGRVTTRLLRMNDADRVADRWEQSAGA